MQQTLGFSVVETLFSQNLLMDIVLPPNALREPVVLYASYLWYWESVTRVMDQKSLFFCVTTMDNPSRLVLLKLHQNCKIDKVLKYCSWSFSYKII